MNKISPGWLGLCFAGVISAGATAAEPASGWRGNATGLWPNTTAPVEWHRIAHGALEGMRAQANRPADADAKEAPLVQKGLVGEWLTLGPFAVRDSIANFDDDLLAGEATATPSAGDRTADQTWQPLAAAPDDPFVFGTVAMPYVVLAKPEEFATNRITYAHAYLYSHRGGAARVVVEHNFGLKAWVNGRELYREPNRHTALGYYVAIGRYELENIEPLSGRFECELQPGWNRLLVKVSTSNREDYKEMGFCLRLMDLPSVPYETKNIRWMTELPARSTSTPILVGDRLFLMAEPDVLVCLDCRSGRVLWTAANNYYEALHAGRRSANPAFAARIEPLAAALRTEPDRRRRIELRHEMQQALLEIDPQRFQIQTDDHFATHLGIVGFTMPTPVSDGQHVYVWCGLGVAACYDLQGHRLWINRVPRSDPLAYGSSPALADGILAVFLGKLYGLDAQTGELRWTQTRINRNIAAVQGATFAGQNFFVTHLGEIVRPADGKVLFRPRGAIIGDAGTWGPPVVIGQTMYAGKYGIKQVSIFDFHDAQGDPWKTEPWATIDLNLPPEVSHDPHGAWLDRSTAGSPLVHKGLMYTVDIYGWLYVLDLETKQTVYFQDLGLSGLMHCNAVPVAASPTLVGDHLVVLDNQGTGLVLATGREFRQIAPTASKPSSIGRGRSRPRRHWPTRRRWSMAIVFICAASTTCTASVPHNDLDAMKSITIAQSGTFVDNFSLAATGEGPLSGLTFVVKDIIDVAGHRTGCGNPTWLATHPPATVHAVCVEQLLAAGGRAVGKTISDEIAFSLLGENHFYGTPLNPAAPDRIPGGSSSGSASAVACGLADFALGTDTGGSVRVPASNCGLWGLRPSHGFVSVAGVMPFAPRSTRSASWPETSMSCETRPQCCWPPIRQRAPLPRRPHRRHPPCIW